MKHVNEYKNSDEHLTLITKKKNCESDRPSSSSSSLVKVMAGLGRERDFLGVTRSLSSNFGLPRPEGYKDAQ